MVTNRSDMQSAPLFAAIDPADFGAVIAVERYGTRANTFDRFIRETHLHFWDPTDSAYIPFDTPFDMEQQTIVPMDMVAELRTAVADRLTERQRIKFTNEVARWWLSSLLHGEQAGLLLASSLCHLLSNPGAVEYAANQAREEARHVTAFSRYIGLRWGRPFPAGASLESLLAELVSAREVDRKIVGMQLLVEGLAMGVLSVLHRRCTDPVLKRLTQLVMVDEAFHHQAGRIWSEHALPEIGCAQHDALEDWAASCFRVVTSNLVHPDQKRALYESFGLDCGWVRDAMREAYTGKQRRAELMKDNQVFHILIRTLHHAGIITKRTRHLYAVWVDWDRLGAESGDGLDEPVTDGMDYLKEINMARGRVGHGASAPVMTCPT